MKKLLLICIAAIAVLASCNDYETYGDKKEKERNAISKFISDYQIVVIDEDQFVLQGYTTDTARNELSGSTRVVSICRLSVWAVAKN